MDNEALAHRVAQDRMYLEMFAGKLEHAALTAALEADLKQAQAELAARGVVVV